MTIYSDLKDALQLLESVKALQETTKDLANLLNDIDRRLIRLEERFEGQADTMKVVAASAATSAAHSTLNGLSERLGDVERNLAGSTPNTQLSNKS
ncbi:hypothetical protein [Tateyamaria sp.]|jgi:uncharacterized coiled-coil protein SlyX|uniref:hypothetical protein n=1 Tax=Tateyamaria sp. TaxID=1929288 RepID=UPI0032DBF84E|tara:strand:- start:28 stop:315 length:288 start_codon:yes stop_codon:yes gene_type:complete